MLTARQLSSNSARAESDAQDCLACSTLLPDDVPACVVGLQLATKARKNAADLAGMHTATTDMISAAMCS